MNREKRGTKKTKRPTKSAFPIDYYFGVIKNGTSDKRIVIKKMSFSMIDQVNLWHIPGVFHFLAHYSTVCITKFARLLPNEAILLDTGMKINKPGIEMTEKHWDQAGPRVQRIDQRRWIDSPMINECSTTRRKSDRFTTRNNKTYAWP